MYYVKLTHNIDIVEPICQYDLYKDFQNCLKSYSLIFKKYKKKLLWIEVKIDPSKL